MRKLNSNLSKSVESLEQIIEQIEAINKDTEAELLERESFQNITNYF